jgi:hypothetical protein
MELEIKHLVPYLPYGLKFLYNGNIYKMRWINRFGDIDYDSQNDFIDPFPPNIFSKELDLVKLMFRPLSDFQEEQIEEIKAIFDKNWCIAYDDFFDALFQHDWDIHSMILMGPYEILQWFFKNHYDVFGLIEKGLAININNFKK